MCRRELIRQVFNVQAVVVVVVAAGIVRALMIPVIVPEAKLVCVVADETFDDIDAFVFGGCRILEEHRVAEGVRLHIPE